MRRRFSSIWTCLRQRLSANPDDSGVSERIANLEKGLDKSRNRIADLENGIGEAPRGSVESVLEAAEKLRKLQEIAKRPGNREAGTDFGGRRYGATERMDAAFNEVQRRLEVLHRDADLSTAAVERLDTHLRGDEAFGVDTQYLCAVSDPDYASGFTKILAHGESASVYMNDAERAAMEQVYKAERLRAMAEGTLSAGGYALPITVDPTLNLMSNGAINPVRQLATVRTITTLELRLLGTDGVTAAYAAEGTEASDNSPVLAQPDLFTERAQAFVPFSFEIGQDWPQLQQDLMRLFADAKDVLEATKFLSGAGHGSNEPAGILGGVTGSLTSSQKVATASADSVSVADIFALRGAIPPRFLGDAQVCVSPAIQDILWNLVPRASTTDNVLMPDRQHLLELPLHQWSTMATGLTDNANIVIAGDFSKYVIADRLGMNVELVPMLFGASAQTDRAKRDVCVLAQHGGDDRVGR